MSLTPSAYRRSRERSRGQPEEQRAETDDQQQPASIRSFSPAKSKTIFVSKVISEARGFFF